ncbi:MAG: hypothetical protein KKF85_01230 [Gammaproteobacteria bacterium]|nr:hypothetical protein [Rhodocyclaceae bacterium]MBU3908448.1 hypothetical protein [Gammaproteobacteria bacterium]MBU3989313.1 hypothetical protein [Gammaproteobacteria bacterium]MBU4005394.1 hypothetical protein [Gammaproteobacteria bacterium]MBU4021079.1 hypothetical protein [Gammaproteobacteria bacterium]
MPKPLIPRTDLLRRWLSVLVRGMHLVAVIAFGAALFGAPLDHLGGVGRLAAAVTVTGVAMFALDIWRKPSHLLEVAGVGVLAKLLLVGWMMFDSAPRLTLFWIIVVWSALFSHAPATFRHARLFGSRP